MKKIATMITVFFGLLFGGLQFASAGSTNIYVEDWGTVNGEPESQGTALLIWLAGPVLPSHRLRDLTLAYIRRPVRMTRPPVRYYL